MAIRVGINGFGRIGRSVFRAAMQGKEFSNIEIVAINDLTDNATLSHLLKYDSIMARLNAEVKMTEKGLGVDGKTVVITAPKDPAQIPWRDLGVEYVVESTGLFTDSGRARAHLDAGARDKVLKIKNFDIYALKNKIYSLEKLKRYDDAINCCQMILDKDSSDTWTLNSMGLSLNELDRHKEAIEFYDKTLNLDNKDVTALMNKAISLNHLRNYLESIEYYDKAQTIDPSIHEASIAKSQAYEKLGMEDEAFLAAQGVLVKDMEQIKFDAKKNKCSVFHQYCQNEFEELKDKK